MKKILYFAIIANFTSSGQSLDNIKEQLKILNSSIKHQQTRIKNLKNKLQKSNPHILLNKHNKSFSIFGDLRIRYESRERNSSNNRHRFRHRFRIGLKIQRSDDWSYSAGLATGGSKSNSTNDTLSTDTPFKTGDIRLDYASATYKDEDYNFIIGQQKNPFKVENLFFDRDIRPVGISYSKPNFILGIFSIIDPNSEKKRRKKSNNSSFGALLALQFHSKITKNSEFRLATYHYTDATFQDFSYDDHLLPTSRYTIIDIYSSTQFKINNYKIQTYANIAFNLTATGQSILNETKQANNNNFAWTIGLRMQIKKYKINFAYVLIEADSLVPFIKDSDFGSGASNSTNVRGHIFNIKREIGKDAEWSIKIQIYNDIFANNSRKERRKILLFQNDIKYKF